MTITPFSAGERTALKNNVCAGKIKKEENKRKTEFAARLFFCALQKLLCFAFKVSKTLCV